MSRTAMQNLYLAIFLLFAFVPLHKAFAGTTTYTVSAATGAHFSDCLSAAESAQSTEIDVTTATSCIGTGACQITLTSVANLQNLQTLSITFDATICNGTDACQIDLENLPIAIEIKINYNNLTVCEQEKACHIFLNADTGSTVIQGEGAGIESGFDLSIFTTDPNTTPNTYDYSPIDISDSDNVTVKNITINEGVTPGEASSTDVNNFLCTSPSHLGEHCSAPITITACDQVMIFDVTLNNSEFAGIYVAPDSENVVTKNLAVIGSNIMNSFFQGLNIHGPAVDVSIEGNLFFANRGSGINVAISASSITNPSDISNNIFNHNQHDNAFNSSGSQISIAGNSKHLMIIGNRFMNGFMDVDDPNVLSDSYDDPNNSADNPNYPLTDPDFDTTLQCDLTIQCNYATTMAPSEAGHDWLNLDPLNVPSLEFAADPAGDITITQNQMDDGSGGAIASDACAHNNPCSDITVLIDQNEIYNDETPSPIVAPDAQITDDNCKTQNCLASVVSSTPKVYNSGTSPACGIYYCVWAYSPGMWNASTNGLLAGDQPITCSLKIYATDGALLSTVTGTHAHCLPQGGDFDIPGNISSAHSTVQIAIVNEAGVISPSVTVSLAGTAPVISRAWRGGTGCSYTCMYVEASDTPQDMVENDKNCAVGIYSISPFALLTTLQGSSKLNCVLDGANFVIPPWILNSYTAVDVNYQNLSQGSWSHLYEVTF